jgi:hypothetical protein
MHIQGVFIFPGSWYGGYADVYQGVYQGKLVAVKIPRYGQGIPDTYSVSSMFAILDTAILPNDVACISGGPYMATT